MAAKMQVGRIRRWALWIAGISVGAVACLLGAGFGYESIGSNLAFKAYPPPGHLVDVGGRRLHLLCKGDAPGPTVVVEQGAAELSIYWWPVQDEIATFARVCTYDRAGYGWSDAAPPPRTTEDRARDLYAVLTAGQVPGPYVLVGHSYGGPIVSLYARDNLEKVAGVIYVDAPDAELGFSPAYRRVFESYHLPLINQAALANRFGLLRLIATINPKATLSPSSLPLEAKRAAAAVRDTQMYEAALDDAYAVLNPSEGDRRSLPPGALGSRPVFVLSHGQPLPAVIKDLDDGFPESQQRLAALSSDSVSAVIANAGHMMQIDAPAEVVDAIRRVHRAVRDEAWLKTR